MARSTSNKPANTVNKSGSTQPRPSGGKPSKVGGSGSTKMTGKSTPTITPGGATNNGTGSKGARGRQK